MELGLDNTGGNALLDSFDKQARGGLTARLSKKERAAINNVAFEIHEKARLRFISYVECKGMTKKSAFSLDSLCTTAWQPGWSCLSASSKWQDLLQTVPESIDLVQGRIIADNDSMPDVLRKPIAGSDVEIHFLNANLLMQSLNGGQQELPRQSAQSLTDH